MKKVLLFGHSGLLGAELLKLDPTILYPPDRVDIYDYAAVRRLIYKTAPAIIINAAAKTNSAEINKDATEAIKTNVIGAANVAMLCQEFGIRYVFISTDYVYPGTGNHKETDLLYPHNTYAATKLAGEISARTVSNHLTIRTSFGPSEFPYAGAYVDLYTSKDYVDVIAPMILKASLNNVQGILNIGTERKSIYEYAKVRNKNIKPSAKLVPLDFSLDTTRYKKLFNETN